jgi:uncharacterized cupredoxin-like copper-binding protein
MKGVALTVIVMAVLGLATAVWAAAAPREQAVRIQSGTAKNEFAIEPASVTVRAGSPVRFTVVNNGWVQHDLVIERLNVRTPVIDPGGTTTLRFTPAGRGRFVIYCSIPGHREAGMIGTLIVR